MARLETIAPAVPGGGWPPFACACVFCRDAAAPSGTGEAGSGSGAYTSGDPGDPGNAAALIDPRGAWGRATLSYSFAEAVPGHYGSGAAERSGFQPLSQVQREAVRAALDAIERGTAITFVEDRDPTDGLGDIVFGAARLPDGVGGWAYSPTAGPRGGDVWLSTAFRNNQDPEPGSVGFARILHETGHALGLKHAGDYDTTGKDTAGPFLPPALDTRQYTVMAYDPHPAYADTRPETPMVLDLVALQSLYGVNDATGGGDTHYRWDPDRPVIETVWDAGGVDTFDASNHTHGVAIDLRPGHFASLGAGEAGGAGQDNVAIAFGTVIEHAIGGSGGDRLTGNAIGNRLIGSGGDDTLVGGGGDDTLDGGPGADEAVFSGARAAYALAEKEGWLAVTGPDGSDRLVGVEWLRFDDRVLDARDGAAAPVEPEPVLPPATPPFLLLRDLRVAEGSGGETAFTLTVLLDRPALSAVSVDWMTWGLTARKGQDYVGDQGRLTIAAGATEGRIDLRLIADRAREADEHYEIRFDDLRGALWGDPDRALRIAIADDDGPQGGLLGGATGGMSGGIAGLDGWLW